MLGRKLVALVDADGTWLAVAMVTASIGEHDTLSALNAGKIEKSSLRQAILDGGFVAERCRERSNQHDVRRHVVKRDPEQKGFVVVECRWLSKRSFG
ncbi:MAG: hypothetical protein NVSMB6_31720 [Burkholderiaceae bacterium]